MRTKLFLVTILLAFVSTNYGQQNVDDNVYKNTAETLLNSNQKLIIGGYGEVHYNQVLDNDIINNGTLDVHRMVLFFGYNFSKKTQIISEVEMEHVNELWVEQLFLQHKLNDYLNFRAGLLLVPMGIINEFHEPTAFNGVERPFIDGKLAPTTWREIGLGFTGTYLPASLKYQAYMLNGPSSYDGSKGLFSGTGGIRSGRQKAANSYINSPNFSAKVEYFGIRGLNIGVSGYVGNSQSKLYDNIDKINTALIAQADSSVVGISMLGVDARYNLKGLELRGQLYYNSFSNTDQYNDFVASDLGKTMFGYYVEAGYNLLRYVRKTKMELVPFVRYQDYNMQLSVNSNQAINNKAIGSVITTGLTLKLTKGAVLKADVDFAKTKATTKAITTFNAGFGFAF